MNIANTASSRVGKIAAIVALALGGIGFVSTAKAVIIIPGQSDVTPTGTATFGGTIVYPATTTPFTGVTVLGISFTGELTATVYSDPGNGFGAGDLDFVYQFSNDNNPNNTSIENFSLNDFAGFSTNADYVAGSNVAPVQLSRTPAVSGDDINYVFGSSGSGVAYSQSTDVLVIQTNANAYQFGTASLQDGGNARILAPVPAVVPEPATFAMAGFAMLALGMRRRNSKA